MNKAKETEKAHDEFLQPFLHIKKKKLDKYKKTT